MQVTIDKTLCIGCGSCTAIASKTFKIGADTKAEVIEPVGDEEALVTDAVDSCPVQAIKKQ